MAFENTEPKSGLIIQIAIASIVAFVAVRYGVVSLYHQTVDAEYDRKIANAGREQITASREEAAVKLATLDKATQDYALHGRSADGRMFPASTPCEKVDNAPAEGWSQTPTGFVAKPCPVIDAGAEGDAAVDGGVGSPSTDPVAAPKN